MPEWDLTYPPPPIPSIEDPNVEINNYFDDITGFAVPKSRLVRQKGWKRDQWDMGSIEQGEPYKGNPKSWQLIPFGGNDDR